MAMKIIMVFMVSPEKSDRDGTMNIGLEIRPPVSIPPCPTFSIPYFGSIPKRPPGGLLGGYLISLVWLIGVRRILDCSTALLDVLLNVPQEVRNSENS